MKFASRKVLSVGGNSTEPELEAILGIAEHTYVIYDRAGRIRTASERLGPLFHLNQQERDRLQDFKSLSQILSGRLANGHSQIRPPWVLWEQKNGLGREQFELADRERVIERTVRPVIGLSGQITGWVERYREFTSERELPARLLQTDKLAALGQMVAGITHELNNPLTAIMGYGNLLLERPLDTRSMADVRRICQESERAAGIVRNLLTLSRDAKLERTAVNLNEVIGQTLRLCAYEIHRADILVQTDLDPSLPDTLANPVQLQQVVLNLLINSQQAIAEVGRPGRIVLRTRNGGNLAFLQVEDNGPGIDPELHTRIFEPFFTTKAVGVGTGLGLSIVAGILRQHGADIQLTSTGEDGTTFTISLPVAQAETEPEPSKPEQATPAVVGRRILVVETEPGVGRLILDALTEVGYGVELAHNGPDALERVRRSEYDLIVCDWKIRDEHGPELYRAMAEAGHPPRECWLLMGCDSTPCETSRWPGANHTAYLAAPFQLSELKDSVARLLAKQASSQVDRKRSAVESL